MHHPCHLSSSVGADALPVAYGAGTLWLKGPNDGFSPKAVDAIRMALDLGYRHIDGAQMYNTEPETGQAIRESGIARSDIFLTTKTTALDDVEAALQASLAKLGTNYVDLYLIHSPFVARSPEHLQAAWRGMEQCQVRGLARNIGLSSFAVSHVQTILETAVVKPAINQIEMHPYLQQPELRAFLRSKNIAVEAVAPLTPLTKIQGGPVDEMCRKLAAKYTVGESSILLRWVIDQGAVAVTTSNRLERLQAHIDELRTFTLAPEEIKMINEAAGDKSYRGFFADEYKAFGEQF